MTTYELLLFLHILMAIVWVGGGATMQMMASRVMRTGDEGRKMAMLQDIEWVGTHVYTPAAGLLLVLGIFLVLDGNWSFGDAWVSAGIAIWLVSFVTGAAFLGPEISRIGNLMSAEGSGSQTVSARIDRLLLVARLDLLLLVAAVFVMAVKPGT